MKTVNVYNTIHTAVGHAEDQAYKTGFELHVKGSGINLRYQTSKIKVLSPKT